MTINTIPPVEIDDKVRYIGLELESGIQEYFSYLSLREFRFEHLSTPDQLEQIELIFDQGIGVIQGRNLSVLVPAISREVVSLIRKGITLDTSKAEISDIRFLRKDSEESESSS